MYKVPSLEYDYAAFGKYISKDIMQYHHDNHHQAYVDKLNSALEKVPELQNTPLTTLLSNLDDVPKEVRTAVRNHGGGHYNHSLFWHFMSPNGGGEPTGKLASAIHTKYGSFQNFITEFTEKATGLFGSGWVWLQPDLTILTTANQDSPLNTGLAEPILGLDVWEHAYYIDYAYKRGDYVNAWWNIVNWEYVEACFKQDRPTLTLK